MKDKGVNYKQRSIDDIKRKIKNHRKEIKDLEHDFLIIESLKPVYNFEIVENITKGKYFKLDIKRGIMHSPTYEGPYEPDKRKMDVCFISFNEDYYFSLDQIQFLYDLIRSIFQLKCIEDLNN